MCSLNVQQRHAQTQWDRDTLHRWQLAKLNALLDTILPANPLYAEKLAGVVRPLRTMADVARLPFTFKEELLSYHGGRAMAPHQTFPSERYVRFHQTSGTRGWPLVVLDTTDDWQWWIDTWQYVLDAAGIAPGDRALMAFSYGPYIGFWSAHDAAAQRGCLVIPGGGMNTLARLELLRAGHATAVFCTPSYALHMAEVAHQHQMDLATFGIRQLVLAGEPGGSTPAIRSRLESIWRAVVIDHAGATEIGPWGYGYPDRPGLHIIETEFIAEFLSLATGKPAEPGELSELVLTSLGRVGAPVIRYRTGDLVRPQWRHEQAGKFVWLEGGILGRADDMLVIRGVNIFPTAVEQIIRSFPEVVEYRLILDTQAELDQLTVEIEDRLEQPGRVAEDLRLRLGLKAAVRCVPLGSLPRFEGKGRRMVDRRSAVQAHREPVGAVGSTSLRELP